MATKLAAASGAGLHTARGRRTGSLAPALPIRPGDRRADTRGRRLALRPAVPAGPADPALDLDRQLRALSLLEARVRAVLGRLAGAFRRLCGHRRLGFASLDDYARERLGLSGRELQSLAAVFVRLEQLPRIAAAFERGEISWSQTRLLAPVACPASENEWLGRAKGRTVRALLGEIYARRSGEGLRPSASALLESSLDDEENRIEGEATVRVRIGCPARVRLLWRRAVEIGRRMLGAQSAAWRAAEAIAAEGCSAALAGSAGSAGKEDPNPGATGKCAKVMAPAEPVSCHDAFPRVSWPESDSVSGPSGCAAALLGSDDEATQPFTVHPGGARRPYAPQGEDALSPEDLARSLDGLDPFDLDYRMRLAMRSLQTIDARVGRALRVLTERRLHRALGFASLDRYAQERLGISPARARSLVRIDRQVEMVPGLGGGYRRGELSWVRVLTLLPIVRGPFADRWIARATEVHVRRLADEVEWALAVRDAVLTRLDEGLTAGQAARQVTGRCDLVAVGAGGSVAVAPPPEENRIDLAGPLTALGPHGSTHPAETITTPSAVDPGVTAQAAQGTDNADLQTCARGAEGGNDGDGPEIVDSEVTFFAPASVAALLRDAVAAARRPGEARWRGLERLLRHAVAEWEAQPRHRNPVFARDGWRCSVPCCSARRDLHDHHRRYRSRGGGNQLWNRTTACWRHHEAIHAGRLRAYGRAPDQLTWQLGIRPGSPALLVFRGDRYLHGS